MQFFNLHTHSTYCDGASEPQRYIEKALENNFSAIGFSGHSPLPFENAWSIKPGKLDDYCNEINELKERYNKSIQVFLGLEIDYIPGITTKFEIFKKQQNLDYHIGSVHLVKNKEDHQLWFIDGPEEGYMEGMGKIFKNDPRKAVSAYYHQICEMVMMERPDIIGHIDKVKMHNKDRFFSEEELWYKKLVADTLKVISHTDSIIEVNTRGIYKKKTQTLFPDISFIEQCYMMKIPITISSDAHHPDEIMNYFVETIDIIKAIGFRYIYTITPAGWRKVEIS